nr:MAG TPA: hypothetical protein [Caudoviricetes sp.]
MSFVLCYVIDKAVKNDEWRPSAQIKRAPEYVKLSAPDPVC